MKLRAVYMVRRECATTNSAICLRYLNDDGCHPPVDSNTSGLNLVPRSGYLVILKSYLILLASS